MSSRSPVFQASFSAGVISPRLWGRSDVAKYSTGAETIENFIVRPEGGVSRRTGTRFVHVLRDQSEKGRLIPFQYSTVQGYMTVWNDGRLRFIKNRAILTSASNSITAISQASTAVVTYSGSDNFTAGDKVTITGVVGMTQVNNREFTVGTVNTGANTLQLSGINSTGFTAYSSGGTISKIYEVTSPYGETDVPDLQYAQSADYMWLAHPSYAPRNLTRSADTTWTLSEIEYTKGPFGPLNTDQSIQIRVSTTNYQEGSACTIWSSADIFTSDHVGSLFYVEEMLFDQLAVSPWEPGRIPAALGTQWSSNGKVYSLIAQSGVASNATGTIAPAHEQGDAWDGAIATNNARQKWRYLHSRYCIFEITGYTSATSVSAVSLGYIPNGFNQGSVAIGGAADNGAGLIRITTSAAHGYDDGDWVRVNGVAGTTEANGFWQIRYVSTTTFDLIGSAFVNTYSAGSDTVTRFATWLWRFGAFSAARGYPATVALHEQRLFYGNTEAQPFGVWGSRAADYENFFPGTNDDDSVSYNIAASQADPIRWLASSNDLQLGSLSQEFAAFGGGLGDPITPSNTRIVPQSGEGSHNIQPVRIGTETVYVNRATRKVFALVFDASTNSYISQDLTKFADHLFVGRTIERIAWIKNPIQCVFALLDNGALLSLTYNRQEQVFAWAVQEIGGTSVVVEDIASLPSTDGTVDDLWMIVKRTVNGGTVRYVEYLSPPFEPTSSTDKNSAQYMDSALEYSGSAVTSLGGLFHLEGETVKVMGAGGLQASKTVSNGAITGLTSAAQFWIGLGYTSVLRPLRIEPVGAGLAGRTRKVSKVTARILNSLGGLVGLTEALAVKQLVNQTTYPPATTSTPLQTGEFDVNLPGDFNTEGQFTIVQSDPLPLDIIGLTSWVTGSD